MKLYAVILTTEDYINTVIFDNEKEAVDSFDCIDYNVVDEEPAKYSRHGYRIPDKTTRMAQRRLERGFSNEFEPHDRFYSEFGGKKRKTIKRRKNSSKRSRKRKQSRHGKK